MSLDADSRVSRTATGSTGTATRTRYTTAAGSRRASVVVWWLRAWRVVVPAVRAGASWVARTVTPAGWLVVASVLGLVVGLVLGWIELIVAGLIGAVLLVVAIPFLLGGRSYLIDLHLERDRVTVGDDIEGTMQVRNTSPRLALPGRIDIPTGRALVQVDVPFLLPSHVHTEQLVIAARHRGVIGVGPVTSVRSDPIGVLRREVEYVDTREIFVHPRTVPIPSTSAGWIRDLEGNASTRIVDSDISFHSVREYAHGDAQRHIHWKATAKTGTLMVRQFEETRRSRLAVVLSLDAAEYADDDEFELAVSVAGSLGVRALRDARDLVVVTSDEVPDVLRRTIRTIRTLATISPRTLLDDLTRVSSGSSVMPVEAVSEITADAVPDLSIAIVVCGSAVDARRLRSVAAKFPPGVAVLAVRCDRQAEPVAREVAGIRLMSVAFVEDLAHLMARSAA